MKFFVPGANDEKEAESIYEDMKKFAIANLGWQITDRRIQGIRFLDKGKSVRAEVGEIEPLTGETLVAILESTAFLLCTPDRGAVRGMPILVGRQDVTSVTEFDPEK